MSEPIPPFSEDGRSRPLWFWILLLISLQFFCLILGQSLGLGLASMLGIANFEHFMAELEKGHFLEHLQTLRLVLGISHIFLFLVPVWVFMRLYRRVEPWAKPFWKGYRPSVQHLVLGLTLSLAFFPLASYLHELNRLYLPEGWGNAEPSKIQALLMNMPQVSDLLANLILVGLLAGLGEELLFRGLLMGLLRRYGFGLHATVWLAALSFSLIHFDASAFVPRCLYGALFGYLLVWTQSLWIPILGHVLNNSWQLLWLYSQGESGGEETPVPLPWALGSLGLSGLLAWALYQRRVSENPEENA